jgi:hypothetical protein
MDRDHQIILGAGLLGAGALAFFELPWAYTSSGDSGSGGSGDRISLQESYDLYGHFWIADRLKGSPEGYIFLAMMVAGSVLIALALR